MLYCEAPYLTLQTLEIVSQLDLWTGREHFLRRPGGAPGPYKKGASVVVTVALDEAYLSSYADLGLVSIASKEVSQTIDQPPPGRFSPQ